MLSTQKAQLVRWVEHFEEVLNSPPLAEQPHIPKARISLQIKSDKPTKTEIKAAVKQLKTGKTAGPDSIPPEALKVDINSSTDMPMASLGEFGKRKRHQQKEQRYTL